MSRADAHRRLCELAGRKMGDLKRGAAVFQFRNNGMEGHPYIEMPHPVASLSPEEMRTLTLRYVDPVVRQLTA